MSKRTFKNKMSLEKQKFKGSAKKFKELDARLSVPVCIARESESGSVAPGFQEVVETRAGDFVEAGAADFVKAGVGDFVDGEQFVDPVDLEEVDLRDVGEASHSSAAKCMEIKSWAIRNKITQNALNDLLETLRKVGVRDLPLCSKTLFGTSRQKVAIQSMPHGDFLYLGIQSYFCSDTFDYLDGTTEVMIDVGIDGLKLFKSSNRVLWPILGTIVGFHMKTR